MNKENTDVSFHSYIRGIILLGFSLLLLAFIVSGNIRYYIAPKMMPFMYFALVVFIILGVIQIIRSTRKNDQDIDCDCGEDHSMTGSPLIKLAIYSIFVAPIVMGFVLPDKALDSSVAANRGVQYGSGILTKPTEATEPVSSTSRAEAFLDNPDEYFASLGEEEEHYSVEDFYTEEGFNQYYLELAEEIEEQERIIVTDENYLDIMTVLDIHMDQFIGKEIVITGFVYREPEFEDNQMVVARFAMTCCVADAAVYGTLIETNLAQEYENDTWVHVSGTLDRTEYNGYPIPLIHLREITVIDEPDQPYVFPSFR
ncbi:TIGR03943 family putative permease subunit [Alkalihalobacterium alkalinitrilicum]|uniref:TIGR03943 family putative permease subunit n=1 Tax=Alkalihalobacterium alkalinitrilicum TaxID=427920 RepID=UPI0009958D6A|nr:TIGR03943 family protein [Alkalihalobacterium alkalinitrilicum]